LFVNRKQENGVMVRFDEERMREGLICLSVGRMAAANRDP
jgi:hypothetical protein